MKDYRHIQINLAIRHDYRYNGEQVSRFDKLSDREDGQSEVKERRRNLPSALLISYSRKITFCPRRNPLSSQPQLEVQ